MTASRARARPPGAPLDGLSRAPSDAKVRASVTSARPASTRPGAGRRTGPGDRALETSRATAFALDQIPDGSCVARTRSARDRAHRSDGVVPCRSIDSARSNARSARLRDPRSTRRPRRDGPAAVDPGDATARGEDFARLARPRSRRRRRIADPTGEPERGPQHLAGAVPVAATMEHLADAECRDREREQRRGIADLLGAGERRGGSAERWRPARRRAAPPGWRGRRS